MKVSLPKTSVTLIPKTHLIFLLTFLVIVSFGGSYFLFNYQNNYISDLMSKLEAVVSSDAKVRNQLIAIDQELKELKNQDQRKINIALQEEIKNIEKTYTEAVTTYERILDFKSASSQKTKFDEGFAKSLKLLSDRNFASASALLADVNKQIKEEEQKVAAAAAAKAASESVKQSNTPPSSGYSRQRVKSSVGEFLVDIVTADLNSTRVIIDTVSDSDCRDNCPVLPLADFASRSGAYAGINGSYFCPAAYPSCAGKTNSFDTLLMNKNKNYFNSDNNVYSTVPAVIFSGNSARFVGQSLEWGRDTGVDAVIANHPLLVHNNNVVFGGNSDPKQGSRGARSFVGATGSTAYIGVVHGVTTAEMARVLHEMGIQNVLNLDSGGSTALWAGGYKVGPGRNIANAVLFVRK